MDKEMAMENIYMLMEIDMRVHLSQIINMESVDLQLKIKDNTMV